MLTLLIGTDWVANTDVLMNMLAQDVAHKKDGRILVVPELISHDTERRLCAVAGDTTSRFAEVLSFTRLARRVAEFDGIAVPECVDNGGRLVAMASAVRQLHSRLKAYASVETRPEFLESLVDAVDEFKRCCIRESDLKAAARQSEGNLAQKLEELSLILASYDSVCAQGKMDPRDQMTWLLDELETSSFGKEHVFYVDGFPDFTRQHLAILLQLIRESDNVVVSLNCDCPNSNLLAFEKSGETAGELLRAAKEYGIECVLKTVPARQDVLCKLRENLFQGRIDFTLPETNLSVLITDTQYHECVAAAQRVLELIQRGVRYRDISIVYADATCVNTLEMTLERCHIPAYFSGTEPILGRSVVATVLSAIETALGGFDKEDVLQYLKSPLSPLGLDLCDKVDNYVLLWNINGNDWLRSWEYHPMGLGCDWDNKSKAKLKLLENARKAVIDPLLQLRDSFKDANNVSEQVKALYRFFCSTHLRTRITELATEFDAAGDNRSAQVLNQLWDILITAMEQLHDVLGNTTWDSQTFSRLFRLLLSQYDVGTIPTVLDSVVVGPVTAMRCQRVKHLILLGALEGNLPSYGGNSGVLTDQERQTLRNMGVPLTGGTLDGLKVEFAEIYGAFCGATESVTISHPGGQPSFVYRRLLDMAIAERSVDDLPGAALTDELEAGAYLVRYQAEKTAEDLGLSQQYQMIKNCATHCIGKVTRENVRSMYGTRLTLSASQVDKLADCRFHYFMRYGVRAKEMKPATVDAAEFGTYVHDVLENTAREISRLGGFHNVSQEQTLEIAHKFSMAYAKQRFAQLDADRINYLFNRNVQELELIVMELWDELHNSKFEPIGFEVSFGEEAQMPAVDCSGTEMEAQLEGYVDRVDRLHDGSRSFFRVVDYKTGRKDFDYCDVFNGLGLQMLLYMFALEQHGKELLGDDAIPTGVQYFPARVPYLSADGKLSDEEAESLRMGRWKRSGLLLSDDMVLNAMGSEDSAFRFPFKRKKDGSLSGDIANARQFEMLKAHIFNTLKALVDDVSSGNVKPNPYMRGSNHSACAFCPYGEVCHKTQVPDRRNYKAMTANEFWNHLQEEVNDCG